MKKISVSVFVIAALSLAVRFTKEVKKELRNQKLPQE